MACTFFGVAKVASVARRQPVRVTAFNLNVFDFSGKELGCWQEVQLSVAPEEVVIASINRDFLGNPFALLRIVVSELALTVDVECEFAEVASL